MSPKPFTFFITLYLMVICSGCEAFKILTAVNHKPEIESPDSIKDFAKKHHIDGFPIFRFDTSVLSMENDNLLKFQMYNHSGQYLSLKVLHKGALIKIRILWP